MTEDEEFEFRARMEAEQAQAGTGGKPPGLLRRGAAFVGRQLSRIPAAIRGYAQAIQTGNAYEAPETALQGLLAPESVQSSEEMMAGFGADTSKYPVVLPPTYGTPQSVPGPNPFADLPPQLQERLGVRAEPETTYTSQAAELGQAFDVLAPTGLEFLPPALGKAMSRVGGGVERAGLSQVQGALKPSTQLRKAPTPYRSEAFFEARPGAPEGLASMRGKEKTLENIGDFHDRVGEAQDEIMEQMPRVNLPGAVAQASKTLQEALAAGGSQQLGLSVKDAEAVAAELLDWRGRAQKLGARGWVEGKVAKNFRGSLADAAKYDRPNQTTAAQVVAATIREELNDQLGNLSPAFRALDRQFAETIPLRNALADALGRDANRYPIGLRLSNVIANPQGLAAQAVKGLAVEGTSRFAPAVMTKRLGEAMSRGGPAVGAAPVYPIPSFLQEALQER